MLKFHDGASAAALKKVTMLKHKAAKSEDYLEAHKQKQEENKMLAAQKNPAPPWTRKTPDVMTFSGDAEFTMEHTSSVSSGFRQGEPFNPTKPCRTRLGDYEWRNGRRTPTQDTSTNNR